MLRVGAWSANQFAVNYDEAPLLIFLPLRPRTELGTILWALFYGWAPMSSIGLNCSIRLIGWGVRSVCAHLWKFVKTVVESVGNLQRIVATDTRQGSKYIVSVSEDGALRADTSWSVAITA